MRRTAGAFLVAAIVGAPAQAAAPASPLENEIAWARASWPEQLKGVHFHSPLKKLLSWISGGASTTVFLYTGEHSCRRATLARAARTQDPGADDGDDPSGHVALLARVSERPRVEDGARVREVTFVEVGVLLSREDGAYTLEAEDAGGGWQEVGGGAGGHGPIVYGALSYVDDRVARWDGEPLELQPYCAGPVEWLPCPAGGERPCERCEEVGLLLTPLDGLGGHSVSHGKRPVTCHDACPKYPESPAVSRVSALASSVQPWQARKAPASQAPSLYRSRDECRRDHPRGR